MRKWVPLKQVDKVTLKNTNPRITTSAKRNRRKVNIRIVMALIKIMKEEKSIKPKVKILSMNQ